MPATSPSLQTVLRELQVKTVAMIMGVVFFAAVTMYLVVSDRPPPGNEKQDATAIGILGAAAVVMLIAGVVASVVVPGVVARAAAARAGRQPTSVGSAAEGEPPDDTALLKAYQTGHVLRLALLDGPAFFLCVTTIIERNPYLLGLVLVPLAVMAAVFPTEDRLRAWLEAQQMLLGG
jgi:hypothetical protein